MNHTILNHMDQAMTEVFGIPKLKSYRFTLRYSDGVKTYPEIKALSYDEARRTLDHWITGNYEILGCKESA